ncbi:MBL fold metallo-hydrolase [Flexivirga oryzae]|uniref:Cyclase n=1 Tax=Flexivirga oryzae TaxID=1794944 RepID=A0A839N6Z9_9MICO|nr:MBL fold metallo-hydrolase [Flexivirga oryzae]MBB2891883.1 cyclase [Flexivirga oryzae]
MPWKSPDPYVEQVADGVFAYVQPDGSWMINNAGWVDDGAGTVLVVDTLATQARTEKLLGSLEAANAASAAYLVNTHHHPDHTYGNCFLPESTLVVGHERCRQEMLAAGLEATRVVTQPTYGNVRVRPPEVTYTDRMTLHLGDRRVELIHPGPAHTSNDTVVWLPGERVLFSGDVLFVGGQPFLLEGSLQGFPLALQLIRDLDPAIVVPGHGPVLRGAEVGAVLDRLGGYAEWVSVIARRGHAAGSSPLATAQANQDTEFATWQESERLAGNLHRAWSELDGNPLDHRLTVPDVWPDMVALHGGPIPCHA